MQKAHPIIAFDIETVPDTQAGQRLYGLNGSFFEIADAMLAKRRQETEGRTDFLSPPYHRVVMISLAFFDPRSHKFKLTSLGNDPQDEPAMLEAFFCQALQTLPERPKPRLVSWNGHSFDLAVLRYRALLYGINAAKYYDEKDRYNTYISRYHDLHIDLMDVLSGYGGSERVKLDDLCRLLGLPGKTVTEGHRVYQHVARGEWDIIKTYCELDALNTLLLYLTWEQTRGTFAANEFQAICQLIATQLAQDKRPAVCDYASALQTWQQERLLPTRGYLSLD